MGSDHAITHTHRHFHEIGGPAEFGYPRRHYHEHEHDHTSLAESFKIERDPYHRKHFHVKEYDPNAQNTH